MKISNRILCAVATVLLCGIITLGSNLFAKSSSTADDLTLEKTLAIGGNTGGTLHNDFDAPNKDLYVENWSDSDSLVRIRLSEYMELGEGAGTRDDEGANQAASIVYGANINDTGTWSYHVASVDQSVNSPPENAFSTYWNWRMGGQKYYYPVSPSKRGAMVDGAGYVDSESPEGLGASDVNEEGVHTELTPNARVVSMDDWIGMNYPVGDYWVIDSDGWIYWANIVFGGKSTGLLIDKIELIENINQPYYYGININAQIASVDNIENNGDYYVKWKYESYGGWTEKGKDLIDIILREFRPTITSNVAERTIATPIPTVMPLITIAPIAAYTPAPNTPEPVVTNAPLAPCIAPEVPCLIGETDFVKKEVSLSWSAIPGATKYYVYATWQDVKTYTGAPADIDKFTIIGETSDSNYELIITENIIDVWSYRITAVSDCGAQSEFSNVYIYHRRRS
ncbi:MAG: hypothetical protein LBL96_12295 [Clostridiales bacterium]|nr:hypothetical protein [Clostridiales bacterium]